MMTADGAVLWGGDYRIDIRGTNVYAWGNYGAGYYT